MMKKTCNHYLIAALVLFFIAAIFTACKKPNNQQILAAGISFIHASPGTGSLNFVVDGQKGANLNYNNNLGYYAAYPGNRLIGIAKKDSTKYLVSGAAALVGGKNYSFFIIDTAKSINLFMIEDDLSAPETGKAKIRFVNTSPRSAALNVYQGSNPSASANPLFLAKAFKDKTDFITITPSDNETFSIAEGTNTIAILPSVKIENGKIYTLWAKGLKTATDSTKLSLAIMKHN